MTYRELKTLKEVVRDLESLRDFLKSPTDKGMLTEILDRIRKPRVTPSEPFTILDHKCKTTSEPFTILE